MTNLASLLDDKHTGSNGPDRHFQRTGLKNNAGRTLKQHF